MLHLLSYFHYHCHALLFHLNILFMVRAAFSILLSFIWLIRVLCSGLLWHKEDWHRNLGVCIRESTWISSSWSCSFSRTWSPMVNTTLAFWRPWIRLCFHSRTWRLGNIGNSWRILYSTHGMLFTASLSLTRTTSLCCLVVPDALWAQFVTCLWWQLSDNRFQKQAWHLTTWMSNQPVDRVPNRQYSSSKVPGCQSCALDNTHSLLDHQNSPRHPQRKLVSYPRHWLEKMSSPRIEGLDCHPKRMKMLRDILPMQVW